MQSKPVAVTGFGFEKGVGNICLRLRRDCRLHQLLDLPFAQRSARYAFDVLVPFLDVGLNIAGRLFKVFTKASGFGQPFADDTRRRADNLAGGFKVFQRLAQLGVYLLRAKRHADNLLLAQLERRAVHAFERHACHFGRFAERRRRYSLEHGAQLVRNTGYAGGMERARLVDLLVVAVLHRFDAVAMRRQVCEHGRCIDVRLAEGGDMAVASFFSVGLREGSSRIL